MTTRGFLSLGKQPKKPTTKKVTSGGSKRITVDAKSLGKSWLKMSVDSIREDKRPLWGPVKTGGWHPSGMGEPCDRRSILSMYGYRGDPISPKLSRIFDMGRAVEEIWRKDFQRMGILLSANVRVPDPGPPPINGEYDVMVRHPHDAQRRLLGEIKSINCNGYKQLPPCSLDPELNFNNIMETKGYIGNRIRGYMIQFQNYLRLTDTPEGFILFDCKCDSEFMDYYLTYQPDFLEVKRNRLTRLEEFRPELIVPPCTCSGKHEGLCAYRTEDEVPLDEMKVFTEDAF